MSKIVNAKEYLEQAANGVFSHDLTKAQVDAMPITKYQAYNLGINSAVNAVALDKATMVNNFKQMANGYKFGMALCAIAAGVSLALYANERDKLRRYKDEEKTKSEEDDVYTPEYEEAES